MITIYIYIYIVTLFLGFPPCFIRTYICVCILYICFFPSSSSFVCFLFFLYPSSAHFLSVRTSHTYIHIYLYHRIQQKWEIINPNAIKNHYDPEITGFDFGPIDRETGPYFATIMCDSSVRGDRISRRRYLDVTAVQTAHRGQLFHKLHPRRLKDRSTRNRCDVLCLWPFVVRRLRRNTT